MYCILNFVHMILQLFDKNFYGYDSNDKNNNDIIIFIVIISFFSSDFKYISCIIVTCTEAMKQK